MDKLGIQLRCYFVLLPTPQCFATGAMLKRLIPVRGQIHHGCKLAPFLGLASAG